MADLPDLRDEHYDPIAVGLRIKALRKYLGVTQTKLGALLSVSQATVADWERGETRPSFAVANYLKAHYGITYDWLYQGDHSWLPHAMAVSLVSHFLKLRERNRVKGAKEKAKDQ